MRASRLIPASFEIMVYLLNAGQASQVRLMDLQRNLRDGRSDSSIQKLPYNLTALGYLRTVYSPMGKVYALTERGRAVALEYQAGQPVHRPPANMADESDPTESRQAFSVTYAGGQVRLPDAPRWVFDLGVQREEVSPCAP